MTISPDIIERIQDALMIYEGENWCKMRVDDLQRLLTATALKTAPTQEEARGAVVLLNDLLSSPLVDYDEPDPERAEYIEAPAQDVRVVLSALAAKERECEALESACRRQVENIERWLETKTPAGPEESKAIYEQLKAALRAVEG